MIQTKEPSQVAISTIREKLMSRLLQCQWEWRARDDLRDIQEAQLLLLSHKIVKGFLFVCFNLISGPPLFLLVISLLNVNSKFQESRPRYCPSSHSDISFFPIPSNFNLKPRLGDKNRESPHCWALHNLTPNMFFGLETNSCFVKCSPSLTPPLGQPPGPQLSHMV